jgi:predicted  nucleic acid-binding Zn-ribbon protein
MEELTKTTQDFQELKRNTISFNEMTRVREEKIAGLKKELDETISKFDELDIKYGSLNIEYEKVKDQKNNSNRDLEDTVQKLHLTNKVRHETEIRLAEEVEKGKGQNEILKLNQETLMRKGQEIEELDKRVNDLQR